MSNFSKVIIGTHQFFNKNGTKKRKPTWFNIGQMFVPKYNAAHNQPTVIIERENGENIMLLIFEDSIKLVSKEITTDLLHINALEDGFALL